MPEIYTELIAPTAVTHSLCLPFTSASAENIVVAKTSLLQIFTVTTHETQLSSQSPSAKDGTEVDRRVQDGDDEQGGFVTDLALQKSQVEAATKLVLVAEYNLYGSVTGLQHIKMLSSKSGGDALLVSTRNAKLSLLEWDPEIAAVSTISLHYYEREEFISPVAGEDLPTMLVTDPTSRCAALKFAGDMLAILPFRQREDEDLELGDADVEENKDSMMLDDDDWDPAAEDGKPPINGAGIPKTMESKKKNANNSDKPYNSSFVVSAAQLDDQIQHIVSLAFLHEYREPTFGILYAPRRTWTGLLAADGRKDTTAYIVITLDLDQKASTPILSVSGLPYDIFQVVALTPPIGGSLLIGGNEIIHVDQAGKTTGVGVNPFAKKSTGFLLADQSELCLALEGSTLTNLEGENGDLLLITKNGTGAIVSFKLDGRNVSGVKVNKMVNHPKSLIGGRATTAIALGGKRLFVGSSEGDARVVKWRRKGEKKKLSIAGLNEDMLDAAEMEEIYEMLDDVDDDLYGGNNDSTARKDSLFTTGSRSEVYTKGEYIFQTHDRLANLGPFRDMDLGTPVVSPGAAERQRGVMSELELVTTSGPTVTTEDAGLSLIRRSIAPSIVGRFDFTECKALWTVRAQGSKTGKSATGIGVGEELERSVDEEFDRFLFVSKTDESQVFRVGDTFEEVRGSDFDSDGETIEVGVVGDGSRIVQVVSEQVRVYDRDLQLAQIIPMFDEETGEEGPAVSKARICDPFVVLLRVDGSVVVYKLDKSMELGEEDRVPIKSSKYSHASLYPARKGTVIHAETNNSQSGGVDYILTLLTNEGALQIYNLTDSTETIFLAENFNILPPLLKASSTLTTVPSRTNATEDVREILMADLGDQVSKEPYLIVRNAQDDLTLYKLFLTPSHSVAFTKISNPSIASSRPGVEAPPFRPMVTMENVSGFACVFLPGSDPSFVIKSSKSVPHIHPLAGNPVRSLAPFHTAGADRGFVYVDITGVVRVSLLPEGFGYESAWSARKIYLNESIRALSYFPPMEVYAVSAAQQVPFSIDEDDGSAPVDETTLQPTTESSSICLVNPLTWSVVDRYPLAHNEVALVVKTVSLEISEHTHERRQLVAVGTGMLRGEDHSARGSIYVFEVIEVVPEPNRPETNRKLKLVAREEVKGTVSALCGVNGYLLAAQGQKVMVRGLKEDQSLLPVAFMDMNMYVSVAKSLGSMVLFGDVLKSVWFTGFSEEPYKMTLFGKDSQNLDVVTADFLPDGEQLYFVVADAESNFHILQYDPEHPKSLSGQRLIRRSTFHSGHEITSLRLLPHSSFPQSQNILLAATLTGGLSQLSILKETEYRRLNILQGQIMNGEEHVAGLNPRAYRYVATADRTGELLRGVLDAGVIGRWRELSTMRRAEVESRLGGVEVRGDWESVHGGLGYL